ncbi:MAG TPA: NADH-quinone oxidoreductase subunit L [Actinomycetota bacterium]
MSVDAPAIMKAAWLIPALPLFGAAVLTFFGPKMKRASGPFATMMMAGAATVSGIVFFQMLGATERTFVGTLYSWISAGSFQVAVDYRVDPLSILFCLVVTGVGALIHLYSVGYMKGDPREPRYFAYLNLFAFSMLVLVLANNFLLLYVGWELVGLCSYLLIGFWFEVRENASAAKKAFITNRVGDFSFSIGIFLIFAQIGSLDFGTVFASAPAVLSAGTATAIALLLFGGATGKSAQIPLYVWLPDAMAGPTPVSALIHAATMVTAGVYMVARTHVFFDLSAASGDVVAWIGLATALLAGLIAIAQDDIKRVLAYSTVSQLGFMFVALGVGAYATGVFHVVTHAFFKALLFLGAGSVMHALANRTDVTQMGGLWRKIPWTMATFVAGWLAIIGFPFTSGFFSKDQILEAAYGSGNDALWILLLVATLVTGFYMTRLLVLTFFGPSRVPDGVHPHESPPSMLFPLVLLGAAALLGGLLGARPEDGAIQRFLQPVTAPSVTSELGFEGEVPFVEDLERPEAFPHREGGLSEGQLSGLATAAGVGGAAVALIMYAGAFDWRRRRENPGLAWRAARNKFFVDEVYQFLFTSLGRLGATALAFVVDTRWIDGVVNGAGMMTTRLATLGRRLQTGFVRSYAIGVLAGGVGLMAFFFVRSVV